MAGVPCTLLDTAGERDSKLQLEESKTGTPAIGNSSYHMHMAEHTS